MSHQPPPGMSPDEIAAAVRLAYEAGFSEGERLGFRQGYVTGSEDTPLIEEALASVPPWAVVQAEIEQRDRRCQQIQRGEFQRRPAGATPSLDKLRAAGLDVPGYEIGVIEAELAQLVAEPGEIGVIREAGLSHAPHWLGVHEGLRDVLAASLAKARGDSPGWIAVLAHGDPMGMTQAAIVVLAEVIRDEAMEYGVCLECVAERLADAAESG